MTFEVLVQGNNLISKAIIYSSTRYSTNKSHTILPFQNKRDTKLPKTMYCLSHGEHNINFNETKLKLIYCNLGDALEVDCELKKYQEIKIIGDSKEHIDNFIEHCKDIYNIEVKELESVEEKIICFVYDVDYWCKLNKQYKRKIDTLCFNDNEHFKLLDKIKQFTKKETENEYRSFGIPYKMNVLLEGLPGTGKTSLIYAIASTLNMNIAMVSFDAKMTDISLMRAIKKTPENSILVFEDIDVLFKERKDNDTNSGISFSGLLNCLDGVCSSYGQIVFMTTNFCCNLDVALKRPGRVDYSLHFDYATKKQKQLLFDKFFPKEKELKKSFIKEISRLKLTTAILQQYLFSNRKSMKLIENIDELKELVEKNKYDSTNLNLYN